MLQNKYVFLLIIILFISVFGCERNKTVCAPGDGTPQPKPRLSELIKLSPPTAASAPIEVVIGGKKMRVDKLVNYPLCNDNWSGTVYVSCDAEVAAAELDAESNPLFLKGCNLKIAPNTVVYVAAHNDAAYYKGCSCHTGADPQP